MKFLTTRWRCGWWPGTNLIVAAVARAEADIKAQLLPAPHFPIQATSLQVALCPSWYQCELSLREQIIRRYILCWICLWAGFESQSIDDMIGTHVARSSWTVIVPPLCSFLRREVDSQCAYTYKIVMPFFSIALVAMRTLK